MAVAPWIVSDSPWERIEPLLPKAERRRLPRDRLLPRLRQKAGTRLIDEFVDSSCECCPPDAVVRQAGTPLCDRLGIDVPIVQAPIGSASTPELVAAVAQAGALGMLALTWVSVDEAVRRVRRVRN